MKPSNPKYFRPDYHKNMRVAHLKPKQVHLRFRKDEVSDLAITRILAWYKNGIPLDSIRQKCNGIRLAAISLCDIYAILYTQRQGKKCEQRKEFADTMELSLDNFYIVWQKWKIGWKAEDIVEQCVNVGMSKIPVIRLVASLNKRHRATKHNARIDRDTATASILRKGEWQCINGQLYLAIPATAFHEDDYSCLIDMDVLSSLEKSVGPAKVVKPKGYPGDLADEEVSTGNSDSAAAQISHPFPPPPVRIDPAIGNPIFDEPAQEEVFNPQTWVEAQLEHVVAMEESGIPDIGEVLAEKEEQESKELAKALPPEDVQSELGDILD